jgi:hypothetical protein
MEEVLKAELDNKDIGKEFK